MWNGPLFQNEDGDSGSGGSAADSVGGAASNVADSFPDGPPTVVAPCAATADPAPAPNSPQPADSDGSGSGTLAVPDVTVTGDPKISKAYADGYQDGVSGYGSHVQQYDPLFPSDSSPAFPSDDQQNYRTAYNQGFTDGQAAEQQAYTQRLMNGDLPLPAASPGPTEPPEPPEPPESPFSLVDLVQEQAGKPDEKAEYSGYEARRYLELKMKSARLREKRFWGRAGPEDELTDEEREEYSELYLKFGATDADPEALPAPPQAETNEGEGRGEAE